MRLMESEAGLRSLLRRVSWSQRVAEAHPGFSDDLWPRPDRHGNRQ
jgi:hypothetical protein